MALEYYGSGENNTTQGKQIMITPIIEMDQLGSLGTLPVETIPGICNSRTLSGGGAATIISKFSNVK